MRKVMRPIALFASALFLAADSRAQSAVEYPPVSENAALQYWMAFATMPSLDAEQEKLLENWATVPIDDAVNKLLDESQTSLMFMHRGSQKRECDWGLEYRDGARMHLPQLFKARQLARVAALDARRAFETKNYERGQDDAFGMIVLARNVGKDHTLVSMLVDFAIEGMVVELAAPYLPDVHASYDGVMETYKNLPPSPSLVHAVRSEQRLAAAILNQLAEAEHERPGSWRETWTSILGDESTDPFKNAVRVGEVYEGMRKFQAKYDELAELMTLSPAEFDAKYPEFSEQAKATCPGVELMLPAMEKTVAAHRKAEVRMAMLLAAISVVESGPEKLAESKDPFGDGPFTHEKLDTGFRLTSKLMEDGKPMSLLIGQKPEVKP